MHLLRDVLGNRRSVLLKGVGTFLLYAAMVAAIVALWNNDAPSFIYVAF